MFSLSTMAGLYGPRSGRGRRVFNDATGGTISTYTSGGRTFRVHLFASNGVFTPVSVAEPFQVLIVAGGGNGGTGCPNGGGGAGGGGGVYYNSAMALAQSAHSLVVGAALGAFTGDVYPASPNGNDTTAFGITCGGGGGGGTGAWNGKKPAGYGVGGNAGSGGGGTGGSSSAGTNHGGGGGAAANGGNAGLYAITGSSSYYGAGGSTGNGGTYGWGGGDISAQGGPYGYPSGGGVVIVAYEVAA